MRNDRIALTAAAGVIAVVLIALLASVIVSILGVSGPSVRNPGALNGFGLPTGPSSGHPLGVDAAGRDVLARILYGTRIPLASAGLGTVIAVVLGLGVGLLATVGGRVLDAIIGRVIDALLAGPVILVGLGVGAACRSQGCAGGLIDPGLGTVVFVIALTGTPLVARMVRRRTAGLDGAPFIAAARAVGMSRWRLVTRELLPNLVPELAVYAVALIPAGIALEAALAFLGVSVSGNTADWGQMIAGAGHDILAGGPAWWYLVFPGLALLLTVLVFTTLAARLVSALKAG